MDSFSKDMLLDFGVYGFVDRFNKYLFDCILKNQRDKKDVSNYIEYLIDRSTNLGVKKFLQKASNKLIKTEKLKFNEIISIIYAIRNIFIHETDTAKSGVEMYKTKMEVLSNCYDFIIFICLNIGSCIITKKIQQIQ